MLWQSFLLTALVAAAAAPKENISEKRYPDGTVRQRTEVLVFEDGTVVQHGKEMKFHPNSKLSAETRYENGIKEGPWTTWFSNGEKSAEGGYHFGAQHGNQIRYLRTGEKYLETGYRNGLRHGAQTNWYSGDRKSRETQYDQGRLRKTPRMACQRKTEIRRVVSTRPAAWAVDPLV
jgi:antitoxin component YwqK of YwqJK toxin-antitoxin module